AAAALISTRSWTRVLPSISSFAGTSTTPRSRLLSGYCAVSCRAIDSMSARAASRPIGGFSRPTTLRKGEARLAAASAAEVFGMRWSRVGMGEAERGRHRADVPVGVVFWGGRGPEEGRAAAVGALPQAVTDHGDLRAVAILGLGECPADIRPHAEDAEEV